MNVRDYNDQSIRNDVSTQVWGQNGLKVELDKTKAKDDIAGKILHQAAEESLMQVAEHVGPMLLSKAFIEGALAVATPITMGLTLTELWAEAHENADTDGKAYVSMRYELDCVKFLADTHFLTNDNVINEKNAFFKSQGYDPSQGSNADVQKMSMTPEMVKTDIAMQIHFLSGEKAYLDAMNEKDPDKKKALLADIATACKNDYPFRLGMEQAAAMGDSLSLDQVNAKLTDRQAEFNKYV
jgi:hypothetical protein